MRAATFSAPGLALLIAIPLTQRICAYNELPLLSRDAALIFGFLFLAALGPAALVLAAVAAAAPSGPLRRRLARLLEPRPLALVVVAAAGLSAFAWRPVLAPAEPPTPSIFPAAHPGRLLFIGVDGLCWETLRRWRSHERNLDLAWLLERGYFGPLATITPTDSPLVWTTIATGLPPEEHGVKSFRTFEFPALDRMRLEIPQLPGRSYLIRALMRLKLAELRPVSSLDMRRRPFWEIACRPERPCDVVGFWATWPPQPFHGRLVSDRFYFVKSRGGGTWERSLDPFTTFPPQMERRLAPFRIAPEELTQARLLEFVDLSQTDSVSDSVLRELRYGLAMDETYFQLAEQFLEDGARNGLFAFYFRGLDVVSHPALPFSELYPEVPAPAEQRRRFGKLVSRYYGYVFARIRRLVDRAGSDTLVLVASDHGFEREKEAYFNHHFAPAGVLLALGGGARRAAAPLEASVYDITPTLLWLTGYPPSLDMPGRPLVDLFPELDRGGLAAAERPRSYGYRWKQPPLKAPSDPESERRMLELLRTLGYIR
jgi:hypothetical protein